MAYDSSVQVQNAVIANGGTESSAVDCGQLRAARLSMPAAFTGTSLGVRVLASGGSSYQDLYDDAGNLYAITVAAGREVILNLTDFLGIQNFKLVSDAAEGGERTIGVVLIP